MSDLSDLAISEGRAYRPGDVVLLRLKVRTSSDAFKYLAERLRELSARSGVEFVLLSPDVEVVEPLPQKEPQPA